MLDNSLQDRFLDAVQTLKLKFPVAEIAEKTGHGQSTVSTYLSGKREVSLKFLKALCDAYGFNYDDIRFGKKEDDQKKPEESEDSFRRKYIMQLEKENQYLQGLVKDTHEVIKVNLNLVQVSLRSISARQIGAGKVVLHALEKIQKAKAGSLVREVDKEIDQIERVSNKHDNAPA